MGTGDPAETSAESGGAGMGAASWGNNLGKSLMLRRDTTHHTGPEQRLCGATGGTTSWLCPGTADTEGSEGDSSDQTWHFHPKLLGAEPQPSLRRQTRSKRYPELGFKMLKQLLGSKPSP